MSDTAKPRKRWFLMAEVVILVLIAAVWTFTSGAATTAKAAVLEQVIRIDPDNTKAMWGLARMYGASCEHDKVRQECERIVAVDPCDGQAYLWLAAAHYSQEHYADAASAARKAVDIAPTSADALAWLYMSYFSNQQYTDAVETSKEIITLSPSDEWGYFAQGDAYLNAGHYQNAIQSYTRAIELKPQYVKAIKGLAEAYRRSGEYEKAIEVYKRTLTLAPEGNVSANHDFWDFLSLCGYHKEAVEAQRQWYDLSDALNRSFNYHNHCREEFKQYLSPTGDQAEEALYFNIGQLSRYAGRLECSIEAYKAIIQMHPDNKYARYKLAEMYLKMNDKDSAVGQYELLKDLDKDLAGKLYKLIYE